MRSLCKQDSMIHPEEGCREGFRLSKMNIPIPSKIMAMLVPTRLFARLNIASKMLLGYMMLVALMVFVVVYVLVNLQRINNLTQSIVNVDIKVEEASDRMLDALLTQEAYRRRYLILKSEDMRGLFEKRGNEFRTWLAVLKELPDRPELPYPSTPSTDCTTDIPTLSPRRSS